MSPPGDPQPFQSWLLESGKLPKTATSYANAVANKLSDFAEANSISDGPLLSYSNSAALSEVICAIQRHSEFKEFNARGNYMYSSALKWLEIFATESIDASLPSDLAKIASDSGPSETEKKALISARIGQGVFRYSLIQHWAGCAVTGYRSTSLLVASHIKPWKNSSNQERLDPYNGLLLIPNIDKAFDRNFITFDSKGLIVISTELDDACTISVSPEQCIAVSKRHLPYLKHHRENCFRG